MERYEYRCVNAPTGIVVRKETDRDQAVKACEDIINREVAEGWEYVGMDSLHAYQAGLLYARPRSTARNPSYAGFQTPQIS